MIGRFWLGVLLALAGFWLGLARAFGAFGNPLVADGGLLLALLLIGFGTVCISTAVDAERRAYRAEQDRQGQVDDL